MLGSIYLLYVTFLLTPIVIVIILTFWPYFLMQRSQLWGESFLNTSPLKQIFTSTLWISKYFFCHTRFRCF